MLVEIAFVAIPARGWGTGFAAPFSLLNRCPKIVNQNTEVS